VRTYASFLAILFVGLMILPARAQKFAYVESQRILNEYQEYVDAQKQLEQLRNKYDAEYQKMVKEYNDLLQEIDSQSLLLSPEKKQQKMQEAQDKALAIEKYKYEKLGPQGEFYQKSMEITKPIIDKINKLIAKIGEEEGYDFIFDASSGALVHAKPKYDITDQVIEELNKGMNTGKKKK
jgi:outer membrane protein